MTLAWTGRTSPLEGTGNYAKDICFAPGLETTFWDPAAGGTPIDFNGTFYGGVFGIAWSPTLGRYVAVGGDGGSNPSIMTSPDGQNWTLRANPFDHGDGTGFLSGVAWIDGLGLFFALGSDDGSAHTLMTSADGITWAQVACPLDGGAAITACWASDLGLVFIAGSNGAATRIASSPNGTVWTTRTTPWDVVDGDQVNAIGWFPDLTGGGLLIAGGIGQAGSKTIMTSPTGVTWTNRSNPLATGTNGSVGALAWNPSLGKAIAVGHDGASTKTVITSPDGVNWTHVPSLADGGQYGTGVVVQADGRIIVVTANGRTISSSNGGATWKNEASPGNTQGLSTVCYSPDLDQVIQGSTGGLLCPSTINVRGTTYTDGLFVAVGKATTTDFFVNVNVAISPDGVKWLSLNEQFSLFASVNAVCWSPELGRFVAGGENTLGTSPDGIVWTGAAGSFMTHSTINDVAWSAAQSQFVAVCEYSHVGTTNDKVIATSANGVNWTARSSPFDVVAGSSHTGQGKAACYSPALDLWVAVDGNKICTSPDAIAWTQVASGITGRAAAWISFLNLFVLVSGGANAISTSPDGTTWTPHASPLDGGSNAAYGIAEGPDKVIAFGANVDTSVTVIESDDAITWAADTSPFDSNGSGQGAYAGCYATEQELVVAVGASE